MVQGVLRLAFQIAVDDDVLLKKPFGFELAGVVVNDSVTREAITKDQMRKFVKFVHDDNVYYKYYEVVYILFHTGMRIPEFCGLTLDDIDMENRKIKIDHQLQRRREGVYIIEETKTKYSRRELPMSEGVYQCFKKLIKKRKKQKVEPMIDGKAGFLVIDKNGMPYLALHWEKRFQYALGKYNRLYKEELPDITPHVCRHTYCTNRVRDGVSPKTLQCLMGHEDIRTTLQYYTHLDYEDVEKEMRELEEKLRKER